MEKGPNVGVKIHIPVDLLADADIIASRHGLSRTAYIRQLVARDVYDLREQLAHWKGKDQ